ncbi:hypothetical protein [Kaistia sp. UC242_56]|uniref:hypothetical protein n=1 Tax=Kaistia sp. UC242_56 TaxID=3374625 RepID=UPI0037A58830
MRICEGGGLVRRAFGKAIGDLIASGDKELSDEDAEARKTAIFGARYRLFYHCGPWRQGQLLRRRLLLLPNSVTAQRAIALCVPN